MATCPRRTQEGSQAGTGGSALFLHLLGRAGFEGLCPHLPLSPISLPQGPLAASHLCSSRISCQEQGFLKASGSAAAAEDDIFIRPLFPVCRLWGFCLLGLGLAISDKDWAFLSHQNREVGLLIESAASSPGPWPTHLPSCHTTSYGSETAISA